MSCCTKVFLFMITSRPTLIVAAYPCDGSAISGSNRWLSCSYGQGMHTCGWSCCCPSDKQYDGNLTCKLCQSPERDTGPAMPEPGLPEPASVFNVAWANFQPDTRHVCFYHTDDTLRSPMTVGPVAYKATIYTKAPLGNLHITWGFSSGSVCPSAPKLLFNSEAWHVNLQVLETNVNIFSVSPSGHEHLKISHGTQAVIAEPLHKGQAVVGFIDSRKNADGSCSVRRGHAPHFINHPSDVVDRTDLPMTTCEYCSVMFQCNGGSYTWTGNVHDVNRVLCPNTQTQFRLVGDGSTFPFEVVPVMGASSCSSGQVVVVSSARRKHVGQMLAALLGLCIIYMIHG